MSSPTLSPPSAPPRYATPKPQGLTLGPMISKTMELIGYQPMPWQDWAADVIGELREDGLPRWPMVIVSVPRQSGKSALMMSVAVHRILTRPNARVWYTAQTGADAADQWRENLDKVNSSPISSVFSSRRANGSQVLTCKATAGRFSPHPPTEEKLHGKQSDLNIIDEAWAFDEAEAAALMQAIVPTQATRPGAQVIVVSTMGTTKSSWFHGLVDRARAGDPGIALLDWGINPGDDSTDLDVIAAAHPAYGFTVDMASLEDARAQLGATAEFARGYGNRATGALERLIPLDQWQSVQSSDSIPADAEISLAAAIDIDRTQGAIAAGWIDNNGDPMLEIIDVRPGTSWLKSRLDDLGKRHGVKGVCVDAIGPSGPLADEINRTARPGHGIELIPVTVRDLTSASAELYDRIVTGRVKIRPDRDLDLAAEIVTRRRLGDAWTWSRRGSAGSIAALEAATLALFAANHRPAPAAAPLIIM